MTLNEHLDMIIFSVCRETINAYKAQNNDFRLMEDECNHMMETFYQDGNLPLQTEGQKMIGLWQKIRREELPAVYKKGLIDAIVRLSSLGLLQNSLENEEENGVNDILSALILQD